MSSSSNHLLAPTPVSPLSHNLNSPFANFRSDSVEYEYLTLPPISRDSQSIAESLPPLPSPLFTLQPDSVQDPPPSNQEAAQQYPPSHNVFPGFTNPTFNSYLSACPLSHRITSPCPSTNRFSNSTDCFSSSELNYSRAISPRSSRSAIPVSQILASLPAMPPNTRKRTAAERIHEAEKPSKVTRTIGQFPRTAQLRPAGMPQTGATDVVDLVDVEGDESYEDFKAGELEKAAKAHQQAEATKPIKISELECVICMDPPTNLTATHCGHLFCGECLHHALNADQGKKQCPVCRTSISTTLVGKDHKKQPKNGIYLLEMKLMTSKRKGKQPLRR